MQQNSRGATLAPLIEKLAYRVPLDADDRSAVLNLPFTVKSVERSQFIVRERERATHASVIRSGYASRSKLVATGNRQIVSVHMKGEVVDLQNSMLEVADHSVQMLTTGEVAMIAREAIIELTRRRPNVAHAMWIDTLVTGPFSANGSPMSGGGTRAPASLTFSANSRCA